MYTKDYVQSYICTNYSWSEVSLSLCLQKDFVLESLFAVLFHLPCPKSNWVVLPIPALSLASSGISLSLLSKYSATAVNIISPLDVDATSAGLDPETMEMIASHGKLLSSLKS